MPTYQYRCGRCEEQFDLWQSFSDDTLTTCPNSGGPSGCVAPGEGQVRKVFASVGITFKGDGFYKNDYGSNASGLKREKKSVEAASNGSSNGSSSGSSNGSDSGSKDSGSSSKTEKVSSTKSSPDSSSSGSAGKASAD